MLELNREIWQCFEKKTVEIWQLERPKRKKKKNTYFSYFENNKPTW
jgi:hypothetical protein